ncbi:DUF975 family protein [Treponema sp. C6A8]|uniref:DUF975 family protein n=1 Tax=Treponema sp. C6A8 TaxID=1410609 RepID=UPI000489308D|nr:DUF975 family protein [Treponema sp. C6A8]
MFDRKKYKYFARQQLSGRWSIPVIITIITGLVMIIFAIPEAVETFRALPELWDIDFSEPNSFSIAINAASGSNTSTLLSYIQIAVSAIFEMAGICVYLKMSRSPEPVHLSDFFEGLNKWLRAIFAALWTSIWIFLWSLLFVIPGIIKLFAYSQTMFITAEYKSVSVPKALRISNIITNGHKMDLFIMILSFLGWAILASIPAGLGFIFLKPYMKLSFINAYHAMMKEALETGKLRPEDLQKAEINYNE